MAGEERCRGCVHWRQEERVAAWGTCLRIGPYIPSDRRTHDPSALAQTVAEPPRAHRYLRTRAEFGCVLFESWATPVRATLSTPE